MNLIFENLDRHTRGDIYEVDDIYELVGRIIYTRRFYFSKYYAHDMFRRGQDMMIPGAPSSSSCSYQITSYRNGQAEIF